MFLWSSHNFFINLHKMGDMCAFIPLFRFMQNSFFIHSEMIPLFWIWTDTRLHHLQNCTIIFMKEYKVCTEQGRRSHLKSEGAQGGTFFRATFYCIFGRFGEVTHLVNFKKWGGSSLAPSAPPCAPPLIHSLCKHFRKKRKLIKYFSLYWHCTRRMPATVSDVLNSIKQFIAERFFGSPRARTQ